MTRITEVQHNLKNMSLLKDYFNYPGSHKPHSWQYREAKGHTSRNGKCKQPCFLAWTKIGSYVGQQGIHQKNWDTKIALLSDILFRGIFLQPLPSICATLNKLDPSQRFQFSLDASYPCHHHFHQVSQGSAPPSSLPPYPTCPAFNIVINSLGANTECSGYTWWCCPGLGS